MIDHLLELPLITGAAIFLASTIFLGVLIFLLFHFFYVKNVLSKKHERVGRVLFRTSASLLGLLLSFTFASQRVDYYKIKNSLESEASQLVDIHIDLDFFNNQEATEIQEKVRKYVIVLLDEGWNSISENPFQSKTYKLFLQIYDDIHELETKNDYQIQLKENLLQDIDLASDSLQIRFYQAIPDTPFLLYIAIFGFVVTMIFYSVYNPDRISITFISLYNAFIGLVMYFIILMTNPLIGPLQIQPEPFQILQKAIESEY